MQTAHMDVKEYSYFADNQWRKAADNQVFEVHEPYSGKLFARVAAGPRADGRTAVDAAAKAFEGLGGNYAGGKSPPVPEGFRDRQAPPKRDR